MPEIRAQGVSQAVCDRFQKISDCIGGNTNATNMTAIVTLVERLLFSSRWTDIQRKAATLITAQWADRVKTVVAMHPSEVKRVSMDGNGVSIYTKGQGEPYWLSSETWEQG